MLQLEKEYKYQFSYIDFSTLKNYLEKNATEKNTIHQINYYIDTEDLTLKKFGITVRIRKYKNSKVELTIKVLNKRKKDNLHVKLENNIFLDKENFEDFFLTKKLNNYLVNEIEKVLKSITLIKVEELKLKLSYLGELQTTRFYYQLSSFSDPINLDENFYLNQKDYELELETENTETAQNLLMELFKHLKITPLDNTSSKNTRFLKLYKISMKGGDKHV